MEFLAQWVLRKLFIDGPQDFQELLLSLKFDPQFGYLPLSQPKFETYLRECLKRYSEGVKPLFYQTFNYEWDLISNQSEHNLEMRILQRHEPWLEVGVGNELVYAIFSPNKLFEAYITKTFVYPIKIGRTNRSIATRINELQTGSYNQLQVGVVIHTDNSKNLEKHYHSVLEHKRIHKYKQSEWFLSSLDRIKSIYFEWLNLSNQLASA